MYVELSWRLEVDLSVTYDIFNAYRKLDIKISYLSVYPSAQLWFLVSMFKINYEMNILIVTIINSTNINNTNNDLSPKNSSKCTTNIT
jgi:hypothetical protein